MNDRVLVDYDMSGDYNTIIEFLKKCTQKVHLPSAHICSLFGFIIKIY